MVSTWVPADSFGLRLRIVRYELGLSVEEICRRCDIKRATWTKWEHGSQPQRLTRVVQRIVAETGVDRDWLVWGGPLAESSTRWLTRSDWSDKTAA